jgi:hypothetical protein
MSNNLTKTHTHTHTHIITIHGRGVYHLVGRCRRSPTVVVAMAAIGAVIAAVATIGAVVVEDEVAASRGSRVSQPTRGS